MHIRITRKKNVPKYEVRGKKIDNQRKRETERQKERDRETERQKDRKTERQRDRETERQRDRETVRSIAYWWPGRQCTGPGLYVVGETERQRER